MKSKKINKPWSDEVEELRQLLDNAFLKGLNNLGIAKFLIKKGYTRKRKR